MKLIKINDHFYVVDFNIKGFNINTDSAYYSVKDNEWYKFHDQYEDLTEHDFQITHSTEPLEGVLLLDKSEVEELVYGYSVEKMVDELISRSDNLYVKLVKEVWKSGFKAHQELVKDKLFTVEDLFHYSQLICEKLPKLKQLQTSQADDYGRNLDVILKIQDNFIKLLLPKTEWEVEFDEQGKLKLI